MNPPRAQENSLQRYRDLAEKAVACSEADLAEIRLVKQETSTATQEGMNSENTGPVGRTTGTARVFIANRWGICEFHDMDNMQRAIDRAAAHAIHSNSPPVPFPMLAPDCRDTFHDSTQGISLKEIPLRQKTFLCRHYCELLGASIGTGSARVSWEQRLTDRVVVNSVGVSVRETENLGSMKLQAYLPGGLGTTREIAVRGGFEPFTGLEREIEGIGKDLLVRETSSLIAPGVSRVLLDPELTGILVHEAFGHLAEADFLECNPAVSHLLRPGAEVGSPCVSITDNGGLFDMPGSMKWDDEGTPGAKTVLVEKGRMQSWLHTSGTASRNGARPTGNARAADPGSFPEARMSCTYMEPGTASFDDLLYQLNNGLYLKGLMGGATDMDRFSIAVQEVWTVRQGVLHKPVAPVVISGRVTDILRAVEVTGSEMKLTGTLRGCSRRGGAAIPVSYGGPHVLIGRIQVS